jgi:drug/metabolite transporter (DMT)-like permease
MVFWGSSFVWAKVALEYYSPVTIIFFRLVVSVVILLGILLITKQLRVPEKKHWHLFLLLALFEPFLYFLGETNGLKYVDPSMASVIISIIPLFTPFVAYYFLNERIKPLNLIGIIVSIIGIGLLVIGKDMSLQVSGIGLGLLFIAIVAANGYSVMIKKIPETYSVLNVTFWQNAIGMVYFIPVVAIFSREDIFETGFVDVAFWAIVKLGFFASSLAFMFYMYGLRYLPITRVNVFTNSIPIFTILISFFVLGETIDIKKVAGIIVVISGVIISQLKISKDNLKDNN